MRDISLHVLDIAENSVKAGAKNITITINEDEKKNLLILEITDDGSGMSKELTGKAHDPFVTSRTTRKVGIDQLKDALPTLMQVSVERPASGDRCVARLPVGAAALACSA